MAETKKHDLDDDSLNSEKLLDEETAEQQQEEEKEPLNLEVDIQNRSTCERHIKVTIPREDIERYFDKEFSDLMPTAQIPGFRPGRAPRKLIEARFRKDVTEKVKTLLLSDSLAQIHEERNIAAISEPDLDLDAVEVPAEGPLTFEFNLEVRPEFTLPKWKGLKIEKPVREITDADVDEALHNLLANRGRLVPFDGQAEPGDYITANLTFKDGDRFLASAAEEVIRIRPELSFRDGKIAEFDKLMAGVRPGETRQCQADVAPDAPHPDLRGKNVTAIFEVLEVKKLEIPALTPELLEELGGFDLESDLRDSVKDQLGRQMEYEQRRQTRKQITAALTEAANWDLPPEMLKRQSHRELQRAVMELKRSGFNDDDIRAHENELLQNSAVSTAKALKEHFILERIAEEEKIEAADDDFTQEIALIAAQSNESPRRVRAQIEKSGNWDVLQNQIIERKAVDLILDHATFKEVPFEFEHTQAETVDQALGGEHDNIPEAKPETHEPPHSGFPEEKGRKRV
ncbi:MAG: trigger factor [Thermoguttaceae bacterium]|jgi:trigger factor